MLAVPTPLWKNCNLNLKKKVWQGNETKFGSESDFWWQSAPAADFFFYFTSNEIENLPATWPNILKAALNFVGLRVFMLFENVDHCVLGGSRNFERFSRVAKEERLST